MTRIRHSCQAISRLVPALPVLAVGVGLLAACADRRIEPPPAEGRGYPNLGTVPVPPTVEPRAQRDSEMRALAAARDTAIREDQELRSVNPGQALPPPRPRAAAPVRPGPSAQPPAPEAAPPPAEAARPPAEEAPRPQAAAPMPRPELPSSLFMGSVALGDRGTMAEIDRKVLADAVAMAQRTNARIRLEGGRSAEDRQHVANELARLGLPAARVSAGPARGTAPAAERPAIDVFVEY